MAKSTKKPDAAPKAAAKPRKPAAKKDCVLRKMDDSRTSISHETGGRTGASLLERARPRARPHEEDWFRAERTAPRQGVLSRSFACNGNATPRRG